MNRSGLTALHKSLVTQNGIEILIDAAINMIKCEIFWQNLLHEIDVRTHNWYEI